VEREKPCRSRAFLFLRCTFTQGREVMLVQSLWQLPNCAWPSGCACGDLLLDHVPDEVARALREGEFVSEAALQHESDSMIANGVGHSNQGFVFADAEVCQVGQFRQDEEPLRNGGLNLGQFLAEVFHEDLLHAAAELDGLFADSFEALIECGYGLFGEESAGFQRLFDFRVLHYLSDLGIDAGGFLIGLLQVAEKRYE
jgi:hypothetical protein